MNMYWRPEQIEEVNTMLSGTDEGGALTKSC